MAKSRKRSSWAEQKWALKLSVDQKAFGTEKQNRARGLIRDQGHSKRGIPEDNADLVNVNARADSFVKF